MCCERGELEHCVDEEETVEELELDNGEEMDIFLFLMHLDSEVLSLREMLLWQKMSLVWSFELKFSACFLQVLLEFKLDFRRRDSSFFFVW